MKKVLIIIFIFVSVNILYACCKDYRYKSTLSKLEFIKHTGVADKSGTWVLVNFRVVDEFTAIAMGGLISSAKADGTICNDHTIYEAYEDPIENMLVSCDKDLASKKAKENLSDIFFGYYLSNNASNRKIFNLIKEDLNDVFKPNGVGRDIWLEVPTIEFPVSGNYHFILQLKLMSGRILEASSDDISIVK